jgi:hypothetical protein
MNSRTFTSDDPLAFAALSGNLRTAPLPVRRVHGGLGGRAGLLDL